MRAIDADALIAEYDRIHVGPPGRARKLIEDAPTIEPERKKGMWIGYFEPGCENYHCDVCGTAWYPEDLYLGGNDYPKFCPECGAEMENWKSGYEEDDADMREEQNGHR